MGFREQAMAFFLLSALALPLSLITSYPYSLVFTLLFIALQLALLATFYFTPMAGIDEWVAFWGVVAGLLYMLLLLLFGASDMMAIVAFILALAYIAGALFIAFRPRIMAQAQNLTDSAIE